MNNTAQQHALEQANLITQLIKYADRVIVVESASDAERRAFVKLIDNQLPESVGVLALRASPNTEQAEIIREISSLLQLSPGIEAPRQLASAIQAALGNQGRLLTIIENADAWYQTTQWSGLMAHLQAANKIAPNHWLFLLTGAPGLTEKLRSDAQLADLTAEIHRCELLGEADATASSVAAPPPPSADPLSPELHAEDRFVPAPAPKKSHGTALLVAAALSIAVVTFGGFALLTRSHDSAPATPTTQTLALNAPAAPVAPPPTAPAQADNPLPNDGANGTPQVDGAANSPAPLIPPKSASNAQPASAVSTPPAPLPSSAPVAAPAVPIEPPPAPVPQEKPAPKPLTEEMRAPEHAAPEKKLQAPKVHEAKVHEQKAPVRSVPEPKAAEKRAPEKPEHAKPAAPVRVSGVDNAWYRQQKAERAVLQLGAFNDEKAALAFVRKHEAATPLRDWHLFTQVRDGKTLYTVTVGDFVTLAAARDGMGQLPAALRAIKPYPRSFKAIQDILK